MHQSMDNHCGPHQGQCRHQAGRNDELPALGLGFGEEQAVFIVPWPHYASLVVGERTGIRVSLPEGRQDAAPPEIVGVLVGVSVAVAVEVAAVVGVKVAVEVGVLVEADSTEPVLACKAMPANTPRNNRIGTPISTRARRYTSPRRALKRRRTTTRPSCCETRRVARKM